MLSTMVRCCTALEGRLGDFFELLLEREEADMAVTASRGLRAGLAPLQRQRTLDAHASRTVTPGLERAWGGKRANDGSLRPYRGRTVKVGRLALYSLAGLALLYSARAMALGNGLFINPPSPTTDDQIVVYYPKRGCSGEWPRWSMEGRTIEIVVLVADNCLTPLYSSLVLGRLRAGNYEIQLYYRVKGSRSRSFVRSELFSVQPAR